MWKRVVDKRMRSFGETDYSKKRIRVNPKKGDLLNTIIHEEMHKSRPSLTEKQVRKKSKKKEARMSISDAIKILSKYRRKKCRKHS